MAVNNHRYLLGVLPSGHLVGEQLHHGVANYVAERLRRSLNAAAAQDMFVSAAAMLPGMFLPSPIARITPACSTTVSAGPAYFYAGA
jgi:hypothetical protein